MRRVIFLCLLLAGCGTSPYQSEIDAYRDYLQAEVSSGRLSLAEGNYLLQSKVNEVNSRRQADAANSAALGALGLGMMSGPRPIPSNTVNCTTYQRGPYGTMSCQ